MKYAKLENNVATEVVSAEAYATFNATVKALFTQCPDSTVAGATLTGTNTWTPPAAPAAPALPTLTPIQFYMAFTPAERIAIKASTDPEIAEFWATYQLAVQTSTPIDPNLNSVVDGLEYLRARNILASDARIAAIRAGTPQ
jgi:hypothetical protein